MRRYIFPILLALVLAAPFVLRLAVGGASSVGGDGRRLVVVTPHNRDIRESFEAAFSDWHNQKYGEPVDIDYRTPGGTTKIVDLLQKTYATYRDDAGRLLPEDQVSGDLHIAWGGGDFPFDQEMKRAFRDADGNDVSVLKPIDLPAALLAAAYPQPQLAGIDLYDADADRPEWFGVCLSSFGMVYNPALYDSLGLTKPLMWQDLADPNLDGLVALADPTQSGSAAVAYMMVIQRVMADAEERLLAEDATLAGIDAEVREAVGGSRDVEATLTELELSPAETEALRRYRAALAEGWEDGMRQLTLIAANARYFTNSASQVPTDVSQGQAAAGMAIDFYGRVYEELVGGDRVRFVSPTAATAITPDPVAVLYGVQGESLELATRFVEFLLTPEGQRLWILNAGEPGGPARHGLRRPPIRPDVYADMTGWSDRVNPFEEAGGFNQRRAWMGEFGDTRNVWAAAWIDAREALKSSYRTILDAGREDLLPELGSLPITRQGVVDLRSARKAAEDEGRGDQWGARTRIELAERFRDHYAAVAAKARGST
jgi:ABC-type Fe3+ transport system substrate-binding protein